MSYMVLLRESSKELTTGSDVQNIREKQSGKLQRLEFGNERGSGIQSEKIAQFGETKIFDRTGGDIGSGQDIFVECLLNSASNQE